MPVMYEDEDIFIDENDKERNVSIVLMLQNCFLWYKYSTHQEILTTELLKLESWQLNTEI